MGRVTLTLPRLGETMEEARVTEWLVAPGAAFRRGDVLLEVETDKTVVEVPALADGTLVAQLASPGETVALDQPIAEVEVAGAPDMRAGPVAMTPDTASSTEMGPAVPTEGATVPSAARIAASPAARAAARAWGADLAAIPGTGRRGRVTGRDVAALSGGTAATVVLLHGLFDDPRSFSGLSPRLQAAGHAVTAPDLSAFATVDAAVTALSAAVPTGPLILVGHSLGAIVAARVAAVLGHRVERLVLLAPAGLGARINADFLDGMRHASTPDALARALALTGGGPMSGAALAAELGRLAARRAGDGALAAEMAQGGMQQVDIAPDLARLKLPLTVVFGTSDRILDWRDVARLPRAAAIHLIDGAGHLPHHADPGLCAALIAGQPASFRKAV